MQLNQGENVLYPMPYVEGEAHLLVITNQRVVNFGDSGRQEMPAGQLQFVGRLSMRPYMALGLILAVLALPVTGLGIYWIVTSGLLSSARSAIPGAPTDDPAFGAPPPEALEEGEELPPPPEPPSMAVKVLGIVFAPLGLIMIVGGVLLIRLQRHLVLLRGGTMEIKIITKTQMEQTQILATVGALQTSAKAMAPMGAMPAAAPAPAPAAAPPPQDQGDPVKALQDLAQARQQGKISEEEFFTRRDALMLRLRR